MISKYSAGFIRGNVIKKAIKYLVSYLLVAISFLLFFGTLGYYIFVFEWDVDLMRIVMNAFIIAISFMVSITIYSLADKIKSKY